MFIAPSGEDRIVTCEACGYAANMEIATSRIRTEDEKNGVSDSGESPLEKVFTPDKRTIEAVSEYLNVPSQKLLKSLLYISDGGPVFALLRGDHQASEEKLRQVFGARHISRPRRSFKRNISFPKVSQRPVFRQLSAGDRAGRRNS